MTDITITPERAHTFWALFRRRFVRNRLAVAGGIVVFTLTLVALFAPLIAPYDPSAIDTQASAILAPPSASHWFGADDLGRDVLSRMIYGARISLAVGFVAVGIATLIGVLLGAVAGYFGGLVDGVIMRFTDLMLTIPS
ncbi:MAG: ABC transporter permease, partial [Nitrospinae bacterium]|nr:ABC transporter permease [Nitrospinota bacterium]